MKILKGVGVATGLLMLGVTFTKVGAKPETGVSPRFIRTSLAGAQLSEQRTFIRFDPQERYYLISQVDGLGRTGLVRLLLCPDLEQFGYDRAESGNGDASGLGPVRRSRLPRLRTGAGVNIGDTLRQVQFKLGAPQEQYTDKTHKRLYVYRAPRAVLLTVEGRRVRWNYKASYTFQRGRLSAIEYVAEDPNVL